MLFNFKIIIMEGTMPINMEGTPPLTGRALPNLINAVKMLKSKPTPYIIPTASAVVGATLAVVRF